MHQRLGKYELVTALSTGGMAELYLAFAPGPGGFRKIVALKRVLPDLKDDQRFIERFLDEARLTAGLSHPNVGQVFDLGQENGEFYLAMEFISGVALHQVLARARTLGEQLPLGFVCRVVRDAALGLHHAHAHKDPRGSSMAVIHRDVKPNNIMVTFEGVVKVIDFGVAKAKGRLARTQRGMVMGTLQYMPLEQLKDGPVDARSDVFSLGVVLWELLAGRYLYTASTPQKRLVEVTPDIATMAEVPFGVADVVKKALAVNPEARFGTAREMARALEAAFPALYDDEQVGALVTRLFPDTQSAIRELLALSQQGHLDEGAIKAQVRQLRKADRGLTALSMVAPVPRKLEERPVALPQSPAPPPDGAKVAIGFSVVAALLLLGFLVYQVLEARSQRPAELTRMALQTAQAARAALMAKDPLLALRLVSECREGRQPCAGLEPLETDIAKALEASRCGTSAAVTAQLLLAEEARDAGQLVDAKQLLGQCTAGVVVHPLAAEALGRIELEERRHGSRRTRGGRGP